MIDHGLAYALYTWAPARARRSTRLRGRATITI